MGSKKFKCHILHKVTLIYICLVNSDEEPPGQKMFLDDLLDLMRISNTADGQHILQKAVQPRQPKETSSFIRKQLEWLHLAVVSQTTRQLVEQLKKRPSMDVKHLVDRDVGILHMMCELGGKAPALAMGAYPVLRLPFHARNVLIGVTRSFERPKSLAYVSALL